MFIQFNDSPVWLLCRRPFQKKMYSSDWLCFGRVWQFIVWYRSGWPRVLNQIGMSKMPQSVPWWFFLSIVWFISLLIWICWFLTKFKYFYIERKKCHIFKALEEVDWIRWYRWINVAYVKNQLTNRWNSIMLIDILGRLFIRIRSDYFRSRNVIISTSPIYFMISEVMFSFWSNFPKNTHVLLSTASFSCVEDQHKEKRNVYITVHQLCGE